MKQLTDLDAEVLRNEDLVDWYKTADEMKMLKDWADTQCAQVQNDLRGKSTSRSTQNHDGQRKVHEASHRKRYRIKSESFYLIVLFLNSD